MARIRTIKPEMAKHEGLYDAEVQTGLPLRFAWAMLLTVCDREGRFKWRPRAIKADVLPHDDVEFWKVLEAFRARDFVKKYRVGTEWYGWIPSFTEHQVINNREGQSDLPSFDDAEEVSADKTTTSTRELEPQHNDSTRADASTECVDVSATRGQSRTGEGKGREGERKGTEGKESTHTQAREVVKPFEPKGRPDVWWHDLLRRYPAGRRNESYATKTEFIAQLSAFDGTQDEAWALMSANLDANLQSHEWRVKRMTPDLLKYLNTGKWKGALPREAPDIIAPPLLSRTTSITIGAAQRIMMEPD